MRKKLLIIFIITFSVIYYYTSSKNENSIAGKTNALVKNLVSSGPKKTLDSSEQATLPQNVTNNTDNVAVADSLNVGEFSLERFETWIADEAKLMDSTNNNTEEVEIRLRAQAKTLTVKQLNQLASKVHSLGLPINERIFSSYILTLTVTPESVNSQFEVAKKALPNYGPSIPHSEAELKNSQELSIRYIQVDELFSRAKTDANAIDKLKLLAEKAESAQVRDYAARKLKELNL